MRIQVFQFCGVDRVRQLLKLAQYLRLGMNDKSLQILVQVWLWSILTKKYLSIEVNKCRLSALCSAVRQVPGTQSALFYKSPRDWGCMLRLDLAGPLFENRCLYYYYGWAYLRNPLGLCVR